MTLQPKFSPDPTAAEGFDNWDRFDPLVECAEPWATMLESELAEAWDALDTHSRLWFGVDYTVLATDDQRGRVAAAVEALMVGAICPEIPAAGPWDYVRLETNTL